MNFDDFKSAWENDKAEDPIKTTIDLDKFKTARLPLDQLRAKMKDEFWVQCIALLITAFFPQIFGLSQGFYLPFYGFFVFYLAICVYYLSRFYFFYKRLLPADLPTMENLYETYYDIKLHIEIYKSFTYALLPFAFVFGGMIILNVKNGKIVRMFMEHGISNNLTIVLVASFAIGMIVLMLITEFWVRKQYGKYAAQIRQLLDELKGA